MGGLVLLAIPSSPEVDHRGSHKWNVRRYTSWRPLVVDALFYRVPWALSLPDIPLHRAIHGSLVGVVVVVLRRTTIVHVVPSRSLGSRVRRHRLMRRRRRLFLRQLMMRHRRRLFLRRLKGGVLLILIGGGRLVLRPVL